MKTPKDRAILPITKSLSANELRKRTESYLVALDDKVLGPDELSARSEGAISLYERSLDLIEEEARRPRTPQEIESEKRKWDEVAEAMKYL